MLGLAEWPSSPPPLDYRLLVGGTYLSHLFISRPRTQSVFNGCLNEWMGEWMTNSLTVSLILKNNFL